MKIKVELDPGVSAPVRRALAAVREVMVVDGADRRVTVDDLARPVAILPRPRRGPVSDADLDVADLARRVPRGSVGVVVAGAIPAAERDALEQAGLSWCDGRGSLHLTWPGVYVHVDRAARKPPRSVGATQGIGPASLRALQVLLGSAQEPWTVSQLAHAAAISVGQAHTVFRALERNQLLRREGRGPLQRSTITDRRAARDWLASIDRARRRPQAAATYLWARTPDEVAHRFAELAGEAGISYAITGAAASNLMGVPVLTRVLVTHVRIGMLESAEALHRLGLEHLDEQGAGRGLNLELWTDTGELGTFDKRHVNGVRVASPIRVWLDIAREGGRGEDAAQMFREHVLEGA